jgi:hypothetical protein
LTCDKGSVPKAMKKSELMLAKKSLAAKQVKQESVVSCFYSIFCCCFFITLSLVVA